MNTTALKDKIRTQAEAHGSYALRSPEKRPLVDAELEKLGVGQDTQFAWFFSNFVATAILPDADWFPNELMDLISPTTVISNGTAWARDVWELPDGYVALSSGEGGGFVLYETATEKVFDVGIEQFADMASGKLEADFSSFLEFVDMYTSHSGRSIR